MKYIKIVLSSGNPITLKFDQAQALFQSKNQLVMVTDDNGQWTGRVINKAFIVSADRDKEEERTARLSVPALPEPEQKITPEQRLYIDKKRQEITRMLKMKESAA